MSQFVILVVLCQNCSYFFRNTYVRIFGNAQMCVVVVFAQVLSLHKETEQQPTARECSILSTVRTRVSTYNMVQLTKIHILSRE